MIIRRYEISDCKYVAELFYNTVHFINSRDYTEEQLNVWATGNIDLEQWNQSLMLNFSFVAVEDELIVGFGDIDSTGYLDRLYVHKDFQNQGIATAICDELECNFNESKVTTHASITARPFFEKRGYKVIKKQNVERSGVVLQNYIMEK